MSITSVKQEDGGVTKCDVGMTDYVGVNKTEYVDVGVTECVVLV